MESSVHSKSKACVGAQMKAAHTGRGTHLRTRTITSLTYASAEASLIIESSKTSQRKTYAMNQFGKPEFSLSEEETRMTGQCAFLQEREKGKVVRVGSMARNVP